MNKFILWLALVLSGGQVMFIRDLNYTNGTSYDSGVDDWHCSCGALLCTRCGGCVDCKTCKCWSK